MCSQVRAQPLSGKARLPCIFETLQQQHEAAHLPSIFLLPLPHPPPSHILHNAEEVERGLRVLPPKMFINETPSTRIMTGLLSLPPSCFDLQLPARPVRSAYFKRRLRFHPVEMSLERLPTYARLPHAARRCPKATYRL